MDDLQRYNPDGSDLRKAQLIMLDILIEVSNICDRHNIPYWISFGTLLGGVRHAGFIPWDDDLDIEVERKNYTRLLRVLNNELPKNLYLQYKINESSYCFNYAKVRDKQSLLFENNSVDFKERGIFIDIFHREATNLFVKRLSNFILGSSLIHKNLSTFKSKYKNKSQKLLVNTRILTSIIFIAIVRLFSKITLNKKMFSSLEISSMNVGVNIKDIFPLKEIDFEGYKFKCPANSDAYLRAYYGDYMKIPSEDKRAIHSTKIEFFNE